MLRTMGKYSSRHLVFGMVDIRSGKFLQLVLCAKYIDT